MISPLRVSPAACSSRVTFSTAVKEGMVSDSVTRNSHWSVAEGNLFSQHANNAKQDKKVSDDILYRYRDF